MFTNINDITIHYQVEGSKNGTPLVFLNSLGSSLCIWDDVCEHLRRDFHIVRYDKRGHGLSDCPPGPYSISDHAHDLLGLLDHLKIDRAIFAGISIGGLISLAIAAHHPQRVSKMILCDTGAKIGSEQLWNDRIAAVQANGIAPMANAVAGRWFTPDFVQNRQADYRGYVNMLTRTPAEGYAATCAALRDADLRAIVPTIQIPVLVLCGDQDLATPPALNEELAAALPNASFGLIANSGHLPSIEQPEFLSKQIQEFATH